MTRAEQAFQQRAARAERQTQEKRRAALKARRDKRDEQERGRLARARDAEKALSVWRRDEEVDETYNSLFRELLTYMMEDPRHITPCTHLLFIAKNIERMGDHATNVAETISFLVTGTQLDEARPKGDTTPFATAPSDTSENSA